MKDEEREILQRQGYKLVGDHSAVKTCHWLHQKLLYHRPCYKETFYGIACHRCLQMTPALQYCTHTCVFCWRYQGSTEVQFSGTADEPPTILDGCIAAQRSLLSGFKGDPRCDLALWEEAQQPKHVAISLAGEPTLYPSLSELIEECHNRGLTTFLVTNGTQPDVLAHLDPLPTQLYVTVAAPNEEVYKKTCRPLIKGGWERLLTTLHLLPSLDTRKVIRHTLVEGLNMAHVEQYAQLDHQAEPDFVEPKGYVFVGRSRLRLSIQNMPSHQRVREFAVRLGDELGYPLTDERTDSRVVLLAADPQTRFLKLDEVERRKGSP